jgi:hypothetical protein
MITFDQNKTYKVMVFDSLHNFTDWQERRRGEMEIVQITSIPFENVESNIRWYISVVYC